MKRFDEMMDEVMAQVTGFCMDMLRHYAKAEDTETGLKWATFDTHGEDKCVTDEDFAEFYAAKEAHENQIEEARSEMWEFLKSRDSMIDYENLEKLDFDEEYFTLTLDYLGREFTIEIHNDNF